MPNPLTIMTLPAPVMGIDHPLCRTIAVPHLYDGEHYAGIVLDDAGGASYHLILLPGDVEHTWYNAMDWAKYQGGDLPTQAEQRLLLCNAKGAFRPTCYWSSAEYARETSFAWTQNFDSGVLNAYRKTYFGFARAVRREAIQFGGHHA